MDRRNVVGTALVALAIVLFVVPALFPVQAVLVHDTRDRVEGSPSELRDEGHEVIAYENLSERGQELYVETLRNDGEYRVPKGEGAPEFDYLTDAERREAFRNDNESAVRSVVIERPEDDSDLPPADEFGVGPGDEEEEELSGDEQERRETMRRYDAMRTTTEQPPLDSPPQLLRLGAALLAVISLGVGGYLLSSN